MSSIASADVDRLANALRTSGKQSGATTQQVLIEAANYILTEMEVRVPVDTGRLRGSLGVRVEVDRVIVGPDPAIAPYAGYVEFGTAPHDIRPKNSGGALKFTIGGRTIYAKVVHHPGTAPQPFIRPAFQAWVDSLGEMAGEANIKVIQKEAKRGA